MPTGYTVGIGDENITFRQFAMRCAHNFVSDLREEPMSSEIDIDIKPGSYYSSKIKELEEKALILSAVNSKEAKRRADAEYEEKMQFHNEYNNNKIELRRKYEAMLRQVKAWKPPTKDHVGIKKFMIEQIEGSLDFDCPKDYVSEEPEHLTGLQWLEKERKQTQKDLEYYRREYADKCERCRERNEWVRQFVNSLNGTP